MPKFNGAARLRAWLPKNKMTQREFSAHAEIHWTHVNQLCSGRRKPSLAVALKLQRLTDIPVECWLTPSQSAEDAVRRAATTRKRSTALRRAAKQAAPLPTENTTDEVAEKATDELGASQ